MKKTFFLLLGLCLFALSTLHAEENSIQLKLPEDFARSVCSTPRWQHAKVIFQGVQDERDEKHVGELDRKKADKLALYTSPKLEKIFADALKETLANCGVTWVKPSEDVDYPTLSLSIEDFFAGSNKKWLTGKTSAHAQVSLTLIHNKQTSTTTISADIDSKKLRQKSFKQLQSVLNQLFEASMRQIVNMQELQDLN